MKPIAKGWESYRRMVVPADAPPNQVEETRKAFFAGASILFEALMLALDPGDEPTEADLHTMADIQAEIDEFGQNLDREYFGQQEH